MKGSLGTDMRNTLSLTESIRTKVSEIASEQIDHHIRAKIEVRLWDIGWIQESFIYIIQAKVSDEYFLSTRTSIIY